MNYTKNNFPDYKTPAQSENWVNRAIGDIHTEENKAFIEALLHEPFELKLLNYFRDTLSPDIVDCICKFRDISCQRIEKEMSVLNFRVGATNKRIQSVNYQDQSIEIE